MIHFIENSFRYKIPPPISAYWHELLCMAVHAVTGWEAGKGAEILPRLYSPSWRIVDPSLPFLFAWSFCACQLPSCSWLSGKESTCQCRRWGFDPWVRKIPWRRTCQPTPLFLSGKSCGQRSLAGYSPGGSRVGCDLVTQWQQPSCT